MKVGSVVECINAAFNEKQKELIAFLPDRGKMYMVRSVEEHQSKKVGIRLEEIVNPPSVVLNGIHIEPTFDIERFRELNKEKSIKIMSFPIISIQTYLEEINATTVDNASSQGPTQSEVKTYLDKVNDQYKLSRKKTMASKNTLEFCMGLKKV